MNFENLLSDKGKPFLFTPLPIFNNLPGKNFPNGVYEFLLEKKNLINNNVIENKNNALILKTTKGDQSIANRLLLGK